MASKGIRTRRWLSRSEKVFEPEFKSSRYASGEQPWPDKVVDLTSTYQVGPRIPRSILDMCPGFFRLRSATLLYTSESVVSFRKSPTESKNGRWHQIRFRLRSIFLLRAQGYHWLNGRQREQDGLTDLVTSWSRALTGSSRVRYGCRISATMV